MKSYLLGIIVVMVLSAVYAMSNTAEVTVQFLMLEKTFPSQGIWELILFSTGALLMWFFSVGASIEQYCANRKKTKELSQKVKELEDDKKALLGALHRTGGEPEQPEPRAESEAAAPKTKEDSAASSDSITKSAQNDAKPPLFSGLFSKLFGKSNGNATASPEASRALPVSASAAEEPTRERAGENETAPAEETSPENKETLSV
ncbi:MAG: lipopolysaccharide assembly protein LapA domain-containing protein [Synergistaceae bacterium]|jgi:uncharacterized integral membrane protein|nr:lipopolysaccharide assembly protein LapA domain-containing protein [Synergistaceae bacterium]